MPAVISSYDATTKRASVQILPMRKHVVGDVAVPILEDLPVQQPYAGMLYLGFEPKSGDECMVVFCEREIESAKQSPSTYPLKYSRMHNLSDGVVIPFCFSATGANQLLSGVSLIECFTDLAKITEQVAIKAGIADEAIKIRALILKLQAVL